jgi:hypothetical protein
MNHPPSPLIPASPVISACPVLPASPVIPAKAGIFFTPQPRTQRRKPL